jgi:hypothetical protein
MMFRKILAVYCENHRRPINTLVKRKHLGESERRFISGGGGGEEHLVGRYPGNARLSF